MASAQQQTTTATNATTPFKGVNMRGIYTNVVEFREKSTSNVPKNYYEDSFKAISQSGLNLVRYLLFWEGYVKNPTLFMNEINSVAQNADKFGIKVIYTNDQYHTSSWLEPEAGYGFPSFLFESDAKKYAKGSGGGPKSPTDKIWWANWLNRSIKDADGNDGWTLQADFMKKIVNVVDKHPSTLGYEIINEPHVYSIDSWQKVGNYNSFITNQLRTVTQKTILFDRQASPGIGGPEGITAENMAKMAPSNKTNVVFKATLFGSPQPGTIPGERFDLYVKTAQIAGVPICMCEFSVKQYGSEPVSDLDQKQVNFFIQKFSQAKVWGWALWIWDYNPRSNSNFNLVTFKGDTIKTTPIINFVKNAISSTAQISNGTAS
jgi:Cellulase (glycosyl hydrolase family 5)